MHKAATIILVVLFLSNSGVSVAHGQTSRRHEDGHASRSRSPIRLNVRPGMGHQGMGHQGTANHDATHHYAGQRYRHSSLNFFVGVPPAYLYSPMLSYGAYYPGWNYSYWGPTGIYYNPSSNYLGYYVPPSYMPAELNYGPQALDRFLGVRRPPPVAAAPVAAARADAAATTPLAGRLRKSNTAARERARRFLAFGDALFLKQRCHEAAQRYRSAIATAPDLAEAYYRQGFALLAVKQYRLAAKALRIGVELDPEILRGGTLLTTLYGDNHLAKGAHLEQLADKALANPRDGDLLFLIGAFLYADGEGDRAVRFLQKAFDLAKPEATFLMPLLAPPDAVGAELET